MDNLFRRLLFPAGKLVSKYVSPGQTVADLGCGPGFFTLPMARILNDASAPSENRGKLYAIDFDPKSIEKLKTKATKQRLNDVMEIHVGSASNLDFIPNFSVDFVLANGLLCCMHDHLGAVDEMKRILKLGGFAYLSITKLARKNDPRSVTKNEWRQLLTANFEVRGEGEGLLGMWAVVKPLYKETGRELVNGKNSQHKERKNLSSTCICNNPMS
jgi:ubiquinone/menaquinone biosynthesis C-methylase UbiE